jgi:hypothetical protein
MQVTPQAIDGDTGTVEATLPLPDPAVLTFSANVPGKPNAAVTVWARFIVTTQVPVPVQGPLQPAKVEPAVGVATSVTTVPATKLALQEAPQSIDGVAGLVDVTVPFPAPALVTVSTKIDGGAVVGAPLPVTRTVGAGPEILDASVSRPVRSLGRSGVKVIDNVQLALGVTFAQSWVAEKSPSDEEIPDTMRFAVPVF